MVTRGMLGEPARRGGALAGLGLAGSLPCSPVSLGHDRVKERHPDEMIHHGRSAFRWPALSPAGEMAPAVRPAARLHPGRSENHLNRWMPAHPPGREAGTKQRKGACDADRIPRNRDGRPSPPAGGRRARARGTPGTGHEGQGHGGARLPAGAGIEVTLLWDRTSGALTVSLTTRRRALRSSCPSPLTRRSPPSATPARTSPPREWPAKRTLDLASDRAGDTTDRSEKNQ
jgi:hypothetical protein